MTIDTKDMLNSILESISRISYIKPCLLYTSDAADD